MSSVSRPPSLCGSTSTFRSQRSLACFSVDENVLNILWDEGVQMEDLLNFSFDHIEVLAAKHDATVTSPEKLRLWDYIQRMALEAPEWLSINDLPENFMEERYFLKVRSLSDLTDFEFGFDDPTSTPGRSEMESEAVFHPDADVPPPAQIVKTADCTPVKKARLWRRLLQKLSSRNHLVRERTFTQGVTKTSSPEDAMQSTSADSSENKTRDRVLGRQGFLRRSLRRLSFPSRPKRTAADTD